MKVIIATTEEAMRIKLKNRCLSCGFYHAMMIQDMSQLLRLALVERPDLIVVDEAISGTTLLTVLDTLVSNHLPVVVLGKTYSSHPVASSPYVEFIQKPILWTVFDATVSLLLKCTASLAQLEREIEKTREQLRTEKTVQRAKSLLIKHRGLSEDAAHRYIQGLSMELRQSRRKIAEKIIAEIGTK